MNIDKNQMDPFAEPSQSKIFVNKNNNNNNNINLTTSVRSEETTEVFNTNKNNNTNQTEDFFSMMDHKNVPASVLSIRSDNNENKDNIIKPVFPSSIPNSPKFDNSALVGKDELLSSQPPSTSSTSSSKQLQLPQQISVLSREQYKPFSTSSPDALQMSLQMQEMGQQQQLFYTQQHQQQQSNFAINNNNNNSEGGKNQFKEQSFFYYAAAAAAAAVTGKDDLYSTSRSSQGNGDNINSNINNFNDYTYKFWTIEFYQSFFDVTTRQVLNRIADTLILIKVPEYVKGLRWHILDHNNSNLRNDYNDSDGYFGKIIRYFDSDKDKNINTNDISDRKDSVNERYNVSPDLYGPFWIVTTLWMVIGVVGNLIGRSVGNFAKNAHKSDLPLYLYYDFTVVTAAAITVYAFWLTMSLFLFIVMKFCGISTVNINKGSTVTNVSGENNNMSSPSVPGGVSSEATKADFTLENAYYNNNSNINRSYNGTEFGVNVNNTDNNYINSGFNNNDNGVFQNMAPILSVIDVADGNINASNNKTTSASLSRIMCVYGYSNFVFLISAVMCAIPSRTVNWLIVVLSFIWSTTFILMNLWRPLYAKLVPGAFSSDFINISSRNNNFEGDIVLKRKKRKQMMFFGTIFTIIVLQAALCLGFKLYFFNYNVQR